MSDTGNDSKELTVAEIQIRARRERVKDLMVRAMSASEIAIELKVSLRTARSDIAAIRADLAAELSRKDATSVAADISARSGVRRRELWALFKAVGAGGRASKRMPPRIAGTRLAILRELRAEAQHEAELLQKLGIVYQAPRNIRLAVDAVDVLGALPEHDLERLARAMPEDFPRVLTEVVGVEVAAGLGFGTNANCTVLH